MVEAEGTGIFDVVSEETKRRWMLVINERKLSYAMFLGEIPDQAIGAKACK